MLCENKNVKFIKYEIFNKFDNLKCVSSTRYGGISKIDYLSSMNLGFKTDDTKENVVGISARSKGNINVQKIMEVMHGGGHFTAAALSRENATVEEIEAELLEAIKQVLQEEENNESNLTE